MTPVRGVSMTTEGESVVVAFDLNEASDVTLDHLARKRRLRRSIRHIFQKRRPGSMTVLSERIEARFNVHGSAEEAASQIRTFLERFSMEALPAHVVEEVLGISSAERRRWTKDSRLHQVGAIFFRQGRKSIPTPVYALAQIRSLREAPDMLAEWRSADVSSASRTGL